MFFIKVYLISVSTSSVFFVFFQLYEIHRISQCVWWQLSTWNFQFPRTASVGESKESRAASASTATADFRGTAFESNRVRLYWYVLSIKRHFNKWCLHIFFFFFFFLIYFSICFYFPFNLFALTNLQAAQLLSFLCIFIFHYDLVPTWGVTWMIMSYKLVVRTYNFLRPIFVQVF